MQKVNALPIFLSQDTDLKTKDSSSVSTGSNKDTDFSSLVEQHFPEENKTISEKKSLVAGQTVAATKGETIAAKGQNDVIEVNNRQETDAETSLDANLASDESTLDGKQIKENGAGTTATSKNGSLAESEQFISLLYNSDQILAKSAEAVTLSKDISSDTLGKNLDTPKNNSNNNAVNQGTDGQKSSAQSMKDGSAIQAGEHKLSAFSKDELLARTQLKNNNAVTAHSNDQALKDYQLSLQAQQNTTKSQSMTSEQLINAQLASAQPNNKISDLAARVAQGNKSQITEQVGINLYQMPVDPNAEGDIAVEELPHSTKDLAGKTELTQGENKTNQPAQSKGDINAELAAQVDNINDESIENTASSSLAPLKVNPSDGETEISQSSKANSGKVDIERLVQANATSIESSSKAQPTGAQEKQPVMTTAQLQALQQAQTQQKVQSTNSEQQVIEEAGEEVIDPALISEDKPLESSVKTAGKVIDNVTMRTASELHAQSIQASQAKQSNDAYFEHQVSEVLNHNVASDSVQIQKNNIQLQQETISIFRKDFADAVKDKVMLTINQKMQQFDITLDPPEFGNMQVRVNLQGEQASVNFVVQNQQAKDALEQNMHKLRDMLSEQGVDVGGANVEQQDQQQNSNEQGLGQNNDNGSLLANGAKNEENNVEHVLSAQLFDSSATGVDYYA
jgi:flagellar hook-length control protein FliK